jgi:hypothetical protein
MPAYTPLAPNTTCDVFHNRGGPGGSPDIAGVNIALTPRPGNLKTQIYTHWADMPLATDIRGTDNIYVPNSNGTQFQVVGVVRSGYGTGGDFKRVYLNRQAVNWPSQDL